MMIRTAGGPGPIAPLDYSERKKPLPKTAWAAIGVVAAAHVAVGVALYYQRFTIPIPTPVEGPPIIVTFDRPELPKPEPKPIPQSPDQPAPPPDLNRPEVIHETVTETIPFTPHDTTVRNPGPVIDLTPAPDPAPTGTATEPTPPQPPAVIRNPEWVSRPTAQQLMDAYPDRALRLGIEGRATLSCVVQADRRVSNCSVTSQTPESEGFGRAAQGLTRHFRVAPRTVDGQAVEGSRVSITLRFTLPED